MAVSKASLALSLPRLGERVVRPTLLHRAESIRQWTAKCLHRVIGLILSFEPKDWIGLNRAWTLT